MKRISVYAKTFKVIDVAGTYVVKFIFDDLTDSELAQQFYYYLDREDFEYLEEIIAEATLRNIRFDAKNKSRR